MVLVDRTQMKVPKYFCGLDAFPAMLGVKNRCPRIRDQGDWGHQHLSAHGGTEMGSLFASFPALPFCLNRWYQ